MAKQVLANTTDVGSERLHGDGEGAEPKKLWDVVEMRNQPNLPEFLKSYSMTEGKNQRHLQGYSSTRRKCFILCVWGKTTVRASFRQPRS